MYILPAPSDARNTQLDQRIRIDPSTQPELFVPHARAEPANGFGAVARSFLLPGGLPFAELLTAQDIEQAFAGQHALFGQDDIFSTPIVLWAFLAQVLRAGHGRACAAAVADIAMYMEQTGGQVPSENTGDYCRARAKLDLTALRGLTVGVAAQLEQAAHPSWLWHGLHAKLIDGFTFTMPDTPDTQRDFPQPTNQRPGLGFPMARACAVLSLATASICDLNYGPYQGKETGESALLRGILGCLHKGDLAVLDRYFCSYMMLAILAAGGVEFCTRLHQLRPQDFRRGTRLGHDDHLVTWTRPQRPDWMSQEQYQHIPLTMTLRELRFEVSAPGRRVESLTVITSLIDPQVYSKDDLAKLYGHRWNVELDIRDIKQTLNLDHLRCQSPAMIGRELWVTLLAYNLIRKLIATAAALHARQPRQLGFTLACQTVLASWMLLATGVCPNLRQVWLGMLKRIAANQVANRPDRTEPRVIKRSRHRYPMMRQPRDELRKKLLQP